jgi:hypothetical protein
LAATVSAPSFPVLLDAPLGAGPPAVSGGSAIGSVLSCSQGSWAPDLPASLFYRAPASFAFQWSVDGHDIAGATASSYTAFTAGDYHRTVTASNAAGSVTQTSAAHAVAATTAAAGALVRPTISGLRETNRVFRVGRSSTPLTAQTAAARHKRGTVFFFRLDRPATVKIAIQAQRRGRRVGHSCRAESRRLRHRARCTRNVTVATLSRAAHAGTNEVAFTGRVHGRSLSPGAYRARFTATNGAGASSPKTLRFTIVRR